MKKNKIFAFLIICGLVLAFAACTKEEEPICGGWENSKDKSISKELLEYLKNAECEEGYSFEALSLEATQLVSGMNYKLLCNVTNEDGETSKKIVILYVDLDSNSRITEIEDYK